MQCMSLVDKYNIIDGNSDGYDRSAGGFWKQVDCKKEFKQRDFIVTNVGYSGLVDLNYSNDVHSHLKISSRF